MQISSNEIGEISNNNSIKFYNDYSTAHAKITGTIKSLDYYFTNIMWGDVEVYCITLEEGWEVEVLKKDHPEISNLNIGDKVTIESIIQSYFGGNVTMRDVEISGTGSNVKYSDCSKIY